jgi:ubiquinone/menaquinone biosynthesis C-methylase UbiE
MVVEDVMSSSLSTSAKEIGDSEHWLSPAGLLTELDVRPGVTVVEIGAGKAFYAFPIGRRVGPVGRVFAVEWRPWMIDKLRARLTEPIALDNIDLVVGRPAHTHLATASCDLVIFADIWHEIEDRDAALDEARRILRPEGRLAILNWRPDALCPPGPPIEHRVSMCSTLCTVERKSWTLVKTGTIGFDGYLLVFETTDESVQS